MADSATTPGGIVAPVGDAATATVRRDGDSLVFGGPLLRPAIAGLWRQAQSLRAGARLIELAAVVQIDSAGLALLAELADGDLAVSGEPPGLGELRAAYRLDDHLAFAA